MSAPSPRLYFTLHLTKVTYFSSAPITLPRLTTLQEMALVSLPSHQFVVRPSVTFLLPILANCKVTCKGSVQTEVVSNFDDPSGGAV
jgi:hypothetical protein